MEYRNGVKLACMLTLALASAGAGPALAEKNLPGFKLDSMKVSDLPRLADGAVPEVPPPTDTGYYPRARRVDSSVTVRVEGRAGRAEIRLPKTSSGRGGGATAVFVRYTPPVLSWAAVLCCDGRYLGYKGSSLRLPGPGGAVEIKDDALAYGAQRTRLSVTHPWITNWAKAASADDLDRLCAPGRLKGARIFSPSMLPAESDGLLFSYDRALGSLTVSWGGSR